MSTFIWEDPDDGIKYELMYNVPQFGNEREGVLWRIQGWTNWNELPPFAEPPKEAMEFWHGEVKGDDDADSKLDALVHDDLNDLLGVAFRLISDCKRVGIIEKDEEWEWQGPR